jgi:outer membrane protein OmpA-like peptidoglycan-associated protein
MRRHLIAAALGLAALGAPAAAQEGAGKVLDLLFVTRDLVFPVVDLGGKVQPLEVKETETEIRIELAADILFDFDKADIRAEAAEALQAVGKIIRDNPKRPVRVEGHTDAKGADSYNQKLSERRAKSVADWLVKREDLGKTKFQVKGLGETQPVAANEKPDGSDNPEGRQKNRRVEIVVMKK